MTDPTAAANGNNTATSADNKAASPDATAPAQEASDAARLANEGKEVADVAALAKEVADYKDKLLRALADMENLRRRTDREVADARAYGVSSLARDVVGVADNLRRALAAAGVAEGAGKDLRDGVELIERDLLQVLERHGVKRFDPKGAKFDPNFHQAMFEVSDDSIAAGLVAQVIQPGYMIGERVLRAALVGVSKERPKPASSESPTDERQAS